MNGVVTILFTDLVGSTELLGRLGEDRADDLRRGHFAMLRAAISAHGGEEVKNIGDSVMVAFTSPAKATACAVEMQQRVHAHARSGGTPMAIRIGLNAGEATEEDGDYFGTPVVIARRLCDGAEGGQVLTSDVVRALVGSRGGFVFKDLGALTLKGIENPVPACEVVWEPLHEGIPLPRAIAADDTVLIGRDDERTTLRRAFAAARDARPRLILIAGEPGVGKTSLAFDLARDADAAGATVLYGRSEEELGTPYQPFAEALAHLGKHQPELLSRFDLSHLAGFADNSVASSGDPEADRYRLFEAVHAALAAAGADALVVLILDDLHWADRPTLLLLRHLVRAADPGRVLIVGTYRDVELDRRHPLAEMLAEVRREPGYDRILLRGLSVDGVVAYLERRAGQSLDATGRALAEALHRETEGNPFFMREIIRHLAESGAIQERDGRWVSDRSIDDVGLPESVREVIGRRLSRLGDESGDALTVASVIGRDFDLDVLSRVTDSDEDRLVDLLDEAVRVRGVIDEAPDQIDRYSFAHALVRETLYEELSTSRRVRLHRRVGEAIEELYAGDLEPHLGELAHHYHEAAVAGAEDKAIDYSRRAAARAVNQLAFEEAAEHLHRALQTLDASDDADPEVLCETLIFGADVHQWMASLTEARPLAIRAAEIARRHSWPERLARAGLAYGGLWIDIGLVNEELIAMLGDAIAALPESHPMVPLLEARLAMDLFSGDPADLEARSLRAVELARRGSDPRTLAYALVARRHAVSGPSRLEERSTISSEASRLADQVGDANLDLRARAFRIIELVERGDVDATRAEEAAFLRLAQEYRQPFYLHYMSPFIAVQVALREGRFEDADRALGPVTDMAVKQGRVTAIIATNVQRMLLELLRGRPIPSQVVELMVGFSSTVTWGPVYTAWLEEQTGRGDEARRRWEESGRRTVRALGDHWATLPTIAQAAELALIFRDADTARVIEARLAEYSGRLIPIAGTALVSVYQAVDDALGTCAEIAGRPTDAIARYEAASGLHQRWGMRPFGAMSRMRLARALVARNGPGDRERARAVLDAALVEADEIDLGTPLVAESRALRATL